MNFHAQRQFAPRFFDVNGRIHRFDGSLDDFDALPIAQRLHWIQQLMKQVPNAQNWFNNIVGIIEGFIEYRLAESGSWLSIVDAAILQGIQDGYARSAGLMTAASANPGAPLWRAFFDALGRPTKDGERLKLWGAAETAATNYGVAMAAARGVSANRFEWLFWQTGNVYRRAVASFDGGMGKLVGAGGGLLSPGMIPMVGKRLSRGVASFLPGTSFIDPRALWQGRSPVYWFSTTFIWGNQAVLGS